MTMTIDHDVEHTLRLEAEYDDLYEEMVYSDDPAERSRCARRMNEITEEIDETQ